MQAVARGAPREGFESAQGSLRAEFVCLLPTACWPLGDKPSQEAFVYFLYYKE